MARKLIVFPCIPQDTAAHHTGIIHEKYDIKLITPLFGGGVMATQNDPLTPIRPSSIRGHLRFWWRATCGRRYENVQDLRMAEAAVWGSADFPSPVSIAVPVCGSKPSSEVCQVDSENRLRHYWHDKLTGNNRRNSIPGYVLFPFQGKKERDSTNNEIEPKRFIPSTSFELAVSLPDGQRYQSLVESANANRKKNNQPLLPNIENLWQEVDTAVWAWVNFGGIGARTRRGCGALFCDKLAPASLDDLAETLTKRLGNNWQSPPGKAVLWPLLGTKILAGAAKSIQSNDPYQTWRLAVSLLWSFRQGTPASDGVGRDDGYADPRKPGMSRWPEAEIVRRLVLQQRGLSARPNNWHHNTKFDTSLNCFPRAEFGLPIILEIKDERLPDKFQPNTRSPSPLKPTVQRGQEDGSDRLASPVILRPLRFKDGSQEVPLLLLLHTPRLKEIYLKPGDADLDAGNCYPVQMTGTPPGDCPLNGRTNIGSALEAFIRYASEKGWTPLDGDSQ